MRTLILGGARSGKSSYAEQLVPADRECLYVATARPLPGQDFDEDFRARIDVHRARRPQHWLCDESTPLPTLLHSSSTEYVLVDDLGTWLGHRFDDRQAWQSPRGTLEAEFQALATSIRNFPASQELILISPETGMGIIPEHPSGRLFRDELGTLNQLIAEEVERVILVIAGQPLIIKGR